MVTDPKRATVAKISDPVADPNPKMFTVPLAEVIALDAIVPAVIEFALNDDPLALTNVRFVVEAFAIVPDATVRDPTVAEFEFKLDPLAFTKLRFVLETLMKVELTDVSDPNDPTAIEMELALKDVLETVPARTIVAKISLPVALPNPRIAIVPDVVWILVPVPLVNETPWRDVVPVAVIFDVVSPPKRVKVAVATPPAFVT